MKHPHQIKLRLKMKIGRPDFLIQMLADGDIALFVYDSPDEPLWKRAAELLEEVASHGENTSYEVLCLIVATKDDLDLYPHGNSHLHAEPTHKYIQLHGHPWPRATFHFFLLFLKIAFKVPFFK